MSRREWAILLAVVVAALAALYFSGGLRPPGPATDFQPGEHTQTEPGTKTEIKP